MTTDHRAEADALMRETASMPDALEHLLAAIHDLLAERLPKPLVSHDMTEMQDRINETAASLAAVQLAEGGPVGPLWPAEYTCDCGRAIPCRHCPEPGTVTVTLLNPPGKPETWRSYADHADEQGCLHEVGDMLRNVADALDAANTPPSGAVRPPEATESDSGAGASAEAGEGSASHWTLKMLREHLCHEQTFTTGPCSDVLQGAIDAIDRYRPLGPDGSHGDRHTATCGCEDADAVVKRGDLECAVTLLDALDPYPDPTSERWLNRLRAALDADQ